MIDRPAPRAQSRREEFANSLSHGIGLLLAIAALPILVQASLARGGRPIDVAAAWVFPLTMILLYLSSTLFHALPTGRAKAVVNQLDHAAIFLFIAGSYTPFALGALRVGSGVTLFAAVWSLALAGALVKCLGWLTHPGWSTGSYVAVGWLVVTAAGPLVDGVSTRGVALLVAGGVAYTVGALVFLLDARLRYAHCVWHVFVMAGSACHFMAALYHAR